jgi:hypothetical protein
MADPEVQDAADELDRDAAMAELELESADTDEYETVGATS